MYFKQIYVLLSYGAAKGFLLNLFNRIFTCEVKRWENTLKVYMTEWLKTLGYCWTQLFISSNISIFSHLASFFSLFHTLTRLKFSNSNSPHQSSTFIAFPKAALFTECSGSGNSSSVIWWNPSLFQCHASRLNSNLNAVHFTFIWNLINWI